MKKVALMKLRRMKLHHILLGAVLLLTLGLVGWYAQQTLTTHKAQFQQEVKFSSSILRQHADTAIVRVKDLAGFVASGMEEEVDTKLNQISRKSPYIKELGFLYSDRRDHNRAYYTDQTQLDTGAPEFTEFLKRLNETPGLVLAFGRESYPGLLDGLKGNSIIFAQSLRQQNRLGLRSGADQKRYVIAYAVLDLQEIIADLTSKLASSRIVDVSYMDGGVMHTIPTGLYSPGGLRDIALNKASVPALLTANLTINLEFREIFKQVAALGFFVFGLLLVSLGSAVSFVLFETRNRTAKRKLWLAATKEREANNAKSEFLANMSHEIRTPLNGVLGMAELISRSNLTNTQRRYAEQIKRSGSILLAILNDILDMSKLESGRLAIDPVRIDLPSHLQETVSFYNSSAHGKGISLLLDVDSSVPRYVQMDPMRLRQILNNIVSNAIKFTSEGEIVVSAGFTPIDDGESCFGGEIAVSVSDQGIGMTELELEGLFQRFAQANAGTTRKFGGTGLGLSICKQLCEAMGGTITAKSVFGKGSTFTFTLPVTSVPDEQHANINSGHIGLICSSASVGKIVEAALLPAGARIKHFEYGDDLAVRVLRTAETDGPFDLLIFDANNDAHKAKNEWNTIKAKVAPAAVSLILGDTIANKYYLEFDYVLVKPFLGSQLVSCVAEALNGGVGKTEPDSSVILGKPTPDTFAGKKLLLVDDNNVNLLIAEEFLAEFGFVIETASDGKKAIEKAGAHSYDIIFMDCQMPAMDGYEASGILRTRMAEGTIKRSPIVALTANALKGDREKCLDAGMDEFVSKPLQIESLNDLFERLCRRAEFADLWGSIKTIEPSAQEEVLFDPKPVQLPPQLSPEHQPGVSTPPLREEFSPPVLAKAQPAKTAAPVPAAAVQAQKVRLMDPQAFERTRSATKKFDSLLSFYRKDTKDYLETIRVALVSNRPQDAVLPAHTIKSSSRMLGATGLAALAENMESRLRLEKGNSPEKLDSLLAKMDQVFVATLTQMDALVAAAAMPVPLRRTG